MDVDVSEVNLSSTRSLRSRDGNTSYHRSVSPRKTSGRRGRKKKDQLSPTEPTHRDLPHFETSHLEPSHIEIARIETPMLMQIESESSIEPEEHSVKPEVLGEKYEEVVLNIAESNDVPSKIEDDQTPAHRTRSKSPLKRTLQEMLHKEAFILPKRRKRRLLKKKEEFNRGRSRKREE